MACNTLKSIMNWLALRNELKNLRNYVPHLFTTNSSMVFRIIIMYIILSNLHLSGHPVYRELLSYSCLLVPKFAPCILELYDPWQKHALSASYFAELFTFLMFWTGIIFYTSCYQTHSLPNSLYLSIISY